MTKARTNADNVTADIAGITAGTGITGGGTSGTVTITNDMATTIAAAGDLIYGTANDAYAALSLGTAGQLLKVNSGATAPEWGAAPESGGMTLLSTTALTGTTVTISSIPATYKNLEIVIAGINQSSSTDLRFKPNGASPDAGVSIRYTGTTSAFASLGDFGSITQQATGGKSIYIFTIYDYASSRYKNAVLTGVYPTTSGDERTLLNGAFLAATVISSLTITSSVSMTAGTCLIYGVN